MGTLAINFIVEHQEFFYGIAAGWATAHVPQLVGYAFHAAMRVPWLRAAVLADPAKAKALVKQIEEELEKDIDEEAGKAKDANTPPK